MTEGRAPGEAEWVYESVIRSLPGINTSRRVALGVQLLGFETAILLLAWYHDLPSAAIAGTVGVLVAVAGSVFMLGLSGTVRQTDASSAYERVLFGSRIELLLGLVAFILLVVYVFVFDPRQPGPGLVSGLLGERPPLLFSFVLLMLAWDVAYRIGVGWWASVVGFWGSVRFGGELGPATLARFRRIHLLIIGFGLVQLLLVPVLAGHPLLQFAVVGHTVAVTLVSGTAVVRLSRIAS